MSSPLLRISKLSKHFLLSKFNREFLVFLFFLSISGAFWLALTMNETYEKEVSLPVELVGVPNNVIVTRNVEDSIRVTLRDKGYAFINYMMGVNTHRIVLDFDTYASDKGKGVVTQSELMKLVKRSYPLSSTIVSIKPEKLEFAFNYGLSKQVPVRLAGKYQPLGDYYIASTVIDPEKVTVYASRRLLDSLTYVTIEPLNMEPYSDSITVTANIMKIPGVKVVPSKVQVSFMVDVLTEKTIDVPIQVVNVPEGMQLRLFPAHVSVKLNVGASKYRDITSEDFRIEADFKEMPSDEGERIPIHLRLVPEAVLKAEMSAESVDYLIEN